MSRSPSSPVETWLALREELDRELRGLDARVGDRLRCALGCSSCCQDDLTVFELEAAVIRSRHAALLEVEAPSPRGACAFLDAIGGCRIYADRPYVCRTQGLPLRWYAEDEHDDIIEERAICERNLAGKVALPVLRDAPGVELEALPESDTWLVGPWEERLVELECQRSGGDPERVLLRSLFVSSEDQ